IAQPNSGRIARSPGTVPRMRPMACSMSSSPRARASPPLWSTASGKASPVPRMSAIVRPLSQLDHRSGDLHAARAELDRRRPAFDRHLGIALHADLGLSLDGDVLAVDFEGLG